jgi:uncharacterized phage-associated protein
MVMSNGAVSSSAPYDARQVANFILDNFCPDRFQISSMKLLKIIFFVYGWYYSTYEKKLFHNPIEAWEYGPVVRAVWSEFSESGKAPVKGRASFLNLASGLWQEAPSTLTAEDADFVLQTTREYIDHTAWQMSDMTHAEGSPWYEVWHSQALSANLGMRISDGAIREYFANRVNSTIPI